MAWKYINYKVGDIYHFPIIFPDRLVHADVDAAMRRVFKASFPTLEAVPVAAGMIGSVSVEELGGESTTIGLKHNPDDTDLIEAYQYGHGIR